MKHLLNYFLSCNLFLLSCLCVAQVSKVDSLTTLLKTAKHDTTIANVYVELSEELYLSNSDTVIPLCLKSISLADKNLPNANEKVKKSFQASKANALNNIGFVYKNKGDISNALSCYEKSRKLKEEIGDKNGLALSLNNIGAIYENQGNIPKALEYFHISLKLQEETDDKKGMAMSLNNIGYIYQHQDEITKALEYFDKSLQIRESINDKRGIAVTLNNIGSIYYNQGKISQALKIHTRSLKIREEIGDKKGLAMSLNNMGDMYNRIGDLDSALTYFHKGLKIRKEIGNKQGMAYSFNDISNVYLKLATSPVFSSNKIKNINLSSLYADSSLSLSKELGFPENIRNVELTLSKIDSAKGNFKEAFVHYKWYVFYNDSINNEKTRKASVKSQLKYEYEEKEAILHEQQEKERAVTEEKSRFQQIVIWSVALGLLLVIAFSVFVLRSLKTTRIQKVLIEEKQQEILDSIHYAKRIQKSLLPTEKYIDKNLTRLQKNK